MGRGLWWQCDWVGFSIYSVGDDRREGFGSRNECDSGEVG